MYVSYSNYKIFGLGAGGSSLVIFITRQKLLHGRAGQIAHQLLKYKAGSFMESVRRTLVPCVNVPCCPLSNEGVVFSRAADWASKPELLG